VALQDNLDICRSHPGRIWCIFCLPVELLDRGGDVDMIPALAAIAWGSHSDSALLLLSYHLKDTPIFYMNLPWFLGVARAWPLVVLIHIVRNFFPRRWSLNRLKCWWFWGRVRHGPVGMSSCACNRDLDLSLPTFAAPCFYPVGFCSGVHWPIFILFADVASKALAQEGRINCYSYTMLCSLIGSLQILFH